MINITTKRIIINNDNDNHPWDTCHTVQGWTNSIVLYDLHVFVFVLVCFMYTVLYCLPLLLLLLLLVIINIIITT